MTQEPISIKPHHFVDIITSFGKGARTFEPHPYGHAVHLVSQQILYNRRVALRMELGIDDICKPCTHNREGNCDDTIDTSFRPDAPSSKNAWNLLIDQRWCQRLQIRQGDRLSAHELCEKIRDNMGDIADIYREIPTEMTRARAQKLQRGILFFLEPKKDDG